MNLFLLFTSLLVQYRSNPILNPNQTDYSVNYTKRVVHNDWARDI